VATSDSLEGTVDYRTLVQAARQTVESTSYVLLETLAEAVATALLAAGPASKVTAIVHKPGAAEAMGVADVSAAVTLDLEK
jgi:dihydroneopterin aldolase